jgi:hypothetical protein
MSGKGKSRADLNKQVRQEALREQLKNRALIDQVLRSHERMEKLEVVTDGEYSNAVEVKFELDKMKAINDQRLKLINKYLPDLKAQEIALDANIIAKKASELTDDELATIIAAGSADSD